MKQAKKETWLLFSLLFFVGLTTGTCAFLEILSSLNKRFKEYLKEKIYERYAPTC